MHDMVEELRKWPVIAAVSRESDIQYALSAPVKIVFLLHADIFNIKNLVDMIRSSGRYIFIHVDFLEGFSRDKKALDYISKVIRPDGIISTNSNFIKHARENGVFTIQRFFIVDGRSVSIALKEVRTVRPDMIEIMPAIMPRVIRRFSSQLSLPIIAGGLIETKEDIAEVLNAGAAGISTSDTVLWNYRKNDKG